MKYVNVAGNTETLKNGEIFVKFTSFIFKSVA